jgi:predicted nucleic acid-binding protein
MKAKPNIPLHTESGTAYFFFRDVEDLDLFTNYGFKEHPPLFIIHQKTLFCRPGFYFLAGNSGDHDFTSTDVLSGKEFLLLCELIYSAHQELEESRETAKKVYNSNHMVDAFAYALHYKFPQDKLEKKLIDQLNIPGLERSLREALERENYKAAAHIKKRIEQKGYIIFEKDEKILIRRPAPETTNQNN